MDLGQFFLAVFWSVQSVELLCEVCKLIIPAAYKESDKKLGSTGTQISWYSPVFVCELVCWIFVSQVEKASSVLEQMEAELPKSSREKATAEELQELLQFWSPYQDSLDCEHRALSALELRVARLLRVPSHLEQAPPIPLCQELQTMQERYHRSEVTILCTSNDIFTFIHSFARSVLEMHGVTLGMTAKLVQLWTSFLHSRGNKESHVCIT